MRRFLKFSEIFGAIPLTALRFAKAGRPKQWLIVEPDMYRQTKKSWTIKREEAKEVGRKFEEVFK